MHTVRRSYGTTGKLFQKLATKEESATSRLSLNNTVKSTQLPNGLLVVSLDNNLPLSRVAAIFKAGSRYENPNNEGIVHQIRNNLGLPSANYTGTVISYETSLFGGLLECSTSRDFLTYNVSSTRNNVFGALESSLSELLCAPKFRHYDLEITHERMRIDHATIRDDYPAYSIELLHKAAFRNSALGHSLYSPNRMIGKHNENMLYDYFDQYVTSNNGALVGLGVDHETLLKYATELFNLPQATGTLIEDAQQKAKYGGGEMRKERGGDLAVVALAVEGVSLQDPKAQAVQCVLGYAMGGGPRIKYCGTGENRLGRAVKSSVREPCYVAPINLNYVDSGLFGVQYISQAKDSANVAKSIVNEFRKAIKEGVQEQDLQAAKAKVKLQILSAIDNGQATLEDLAVQHLARGTYLPSAELAQLVDCITLSDVNQMAKKVLAAKLSMAAIGNLKNTPYLDELSK